MLLSADGPQASDTVVAEQPRVLTCGDRLTMTTGCALLADASLFSASTVLTAHVDVA